MVPSARLDRTAPGRRVARSRAGSPGDLGRNATSRPLAGRVGDPVRDHRVRPRRPARAVGRRTRDGRDASGTTSGLPSDVALGATASPGDTDLRTIGPVVDPSLIPGIEATPTPVPTPTSRAPAATPRPGRRPTPHPTPRPTPGPTVPATTASPTSTAAPTPTPSADPGHLVPAPARPDATRRRRRTTPAPTDDAGRQRPAPAGGRLLDLLPDRGATAVDGDRPSTIPVPLPTAWTFGDGGTAIGADGLEHRTATDGTFTVGLTVVERRRH